MPRRLFTVEDSFEIDGRGLALVPGIVPIGGESFSGGDPVELRYVDKSRKHALIGGFELLSPGNPCEKIAVLLKGWTKEDVPNGTEVWSLGESPPLPDEDKAPRRGYPFSKN